MGLKVRKTLRMPSLQWANVAGDEVCRESKNLCSGHADLILPVLG